MTAASTRAMSTADTMRYQAGLARRSVQVNVDGISHEESLLQPQPAGNCANWVLGHLLAIYAKVLPTMGQQPVIGMDKLARYDRGSAPILNDSDALPFADFVNAWDETCARFDTGLSTLTDDALAQRVPNSPSGNADETVNSLLFTVNFHQAYHAGQLGVLRRLAGKDGAIK